METKICIDCNEEKPLKEFYSRTYHSKKTGEVRIYYRPRCRSCGSIRRKKYYYAKHEYNKHVSNLSRAKWYARIKLEAMEILGDGKLKCNQCPMDNIRVLVVDHIDNDGKTDKRDIRKIYQYIIANPEESKKQFQLLCRNCNWLKHIEEDFTDAKYSMYDYLELPVNTCSSDSSP